MLAESNLNPRRRSKDFSVTPTFALTQKLYAQVAGIFAIKRSIANGDYSQRVPRGE
jgi:hypothetical protein